MTVNWLISLVYYYDSHPCVVSIKNKISEGFVEKMKLHSRSLIKFNQKKKKRESLLTHLDKSGKKLQLSRYVNLPVVVQTQHILDS